MISRHGKPLTPEAKQLVVSVKHYFDQNRFEPYISSVERTADAIGIGLATVKRIVADYNRNPDLLAEPAKTRGRPSHAVGFSSQGAVRSYIRGANKKGEHITLADIADFLRDIKPDEQFHKATLARTLNRWGFEFGKGTRSQHLKEKDRGLPWPNEHRMVPEMVQGDAPAEYSGKFPHDNGQCSLS